MIKDYCQNDIIIFQLFIRTKSVLGSDISQRYSITYNTRNCFMGWWRHQMEIFSALLALSAGNSPVTGEFPTQNSVTRSFEVSFDLGLNKRLSKQSWVWWFEMSPCSLWRHRNGIYSKAFGWKLNIVEQVKLSWKLLVNGCSMILLLHTT